MSIAMRLLREWHPVLLATAIVLDRFAAWPASLSVLVRPLAIVVGATVVALVVARLLTRRPMWAALLVGAGVAVWFLDPVLMVIYAALSIWRPALQLLGRLRPASRGATGTHPDPTAPATFLASVLLLFAMGGVLASGAVRVPDLTTPIERTSVTDRRGPNVYLLLLDGYPRADTLAETFGYDNSSFLTGLRELGFEVDDTARSNYTKTWLTLAALFNGAYIHDLMRVDPEMPHQYRALQPVINRADLLDRFRSHGYEIQASASAFSTATLESADRVFESGRLNEFEIALLQNSVIGRTGIVDFTPILAAEVRATVIETLDSAVPIEGPVPTFSFTHVMSPHAPFVLGVDDPARHIPSCFPAECGLWEPSIGVTGASVPNYAQALRDQLDGLNPLVLDAVSRIVAGDPDAVVMLMSDHGSRYSLDDADEQLRTLFAYRTPGRADVFEGGTSPVNILRNLLTAYFGEPLEPVPYRAWVSDHDQPLDMVEAH